MRQKCEKGRTYAVKEVTAPERVLTTVISSDHEGCPVPVKTDRPIPKSRMLEAAAFCMRRKAVLPVSVGDVIIPDILGTGADVVSTKNISAPEQTE